MEKPTMENSVTEKLPAEKMATGPTTGEYYVGIDFNPGGHEQVNHIKMVVADLMWGVKSVTKRSRNIV